MNNVLQSTLSRLRLDNPQKHKNLVIIPLFDEAPTVFDYLSLKKALEQGLATITEISEGGSVPDLKVTNKSDMPILLIDGEELIGAKQNRIVNTSILLAAKSETLIPVSCTESGRWGYNSDSFRSSMSMMNASARASKSERVKMHRSSMNSYGAGQSEVWGDVAKLQSSLGTSSPSNAMSDSYEQKAIDVSEYLTAFPLLDHQKGMMAFVNGSPVFADFISKTDAYADVHSKLVKSVAIECLAMPEILAPTDLNNLKIEGWKWLNNLSHTQEVPLNASIGMGTDAHYESATQGASALFYNETLIHLSVFNKRPSQQEQEGALGDSLRRRRQF